MLKSIRDTIIDRLRGWPIGLIGAALLLLVVLITGASAANLAYGVAKVGVLGYAGYWIDRWLFPYGRPHECKGEDRRRCETRRAIIVAACIITATLIP